MRPPASTLSRERYIAGSRCFAASSAIRARWTKMSGSPNTTMASARELLAALQDLVDQLLVLAAVAPEQQTEALHRGRLDADEAVAPVDGQDLGHGPVAQRNFPGEHVPHAAGRRAGARAVDALPGSSGRT